jgi:hypothetical protein
MMDMIAKEEVEIRTLLCGLFFAVLERMYLVSTSRILRLVGERRGSLG